MRKYICDLCGKEVKSEYKLVTLIKELRVNGIKDVCRCCHKELEDKILKFRIVTNKVMINFKKDYLNSMRERYERD